MTGDLPAQIDWHGDPAWAYENEVVRLVILPRRGGKIASIVGCGREWLTQPRGPLLPLDTLPDELVKGDMFGWDECAPTIDACDVHGQSVPLHGELWNQPWREDPDDWLSAGGRVLPFRLSRRVVLQPHGFRLDYRVVAEIAMPMLWAVHPQFAASEGSQVVFDTTAELIDLFDTGFWAAAGGPRSPVALAELPSGRSAKLFAPPDTASDRVWLVHHDGARIGFSWDGATAPYLGVWMDRASIGPTDAIALEPMTGYADSCARAARQGKVLQLTAGQEVAWSLSVALAPG